MRVAITCLLAATTLAAQNTAVPGLTGANSQQQPQQQQPPSDCRADGTVVNGLTGQALPRANIITNSANGSGTSTDAEGKWTISNLSCGPTIFTADKEGYIQNRYGRSASLRSGAGGVIKPVILTSGSAAHDLKIELMPESTVTGKVIDEAGDPAAGAQVRAVRSVVQSGRRTIVNLSSSNADSAGNYRLGGLAMGRYFFCATSNRVRYPVGGGNPSPYGESCFPGPVTDGAAGGLQIEGGQEVHADFTLNQATGVHVRGTLTGLPQNQSSPNAMIQILRLEANQMIGSRFIQPRQAVNGKFDFPNVPPGSYTLRANLFVDGEVVFATSFIDVGGTDLEGVSLVFQPGAPVNGTVQIEDVSSSGAQPPQTGGQTDQPSPNMPAKPSVNVNLNSVGMGNPGRMQWDKEHKSFVFPEVQSGKYRINVNTQGAGYFVKSVILNDHDVRNQEFSVEGATGPIEIVVSNESGILKGTVNDQDGNPAASGIILQCGELPVIQGRSQDDGTLTMRNVPAGPCKAWAFDDTTDVEYADEDWMRRYAGSGADVTITAGSTAQVSLVRRAAPR